MHVDKQGMQIEPYQTGREKRKIALRWQLFSTPWLYLELWSFSTGNINYIFCVLFS